MKDLNSILKGFSQKKILVLGDIMLDHYIRGKVERISPEAPVPVLDVHNEEFRLGGSANVALNLRALGAGVFLCGVVGTDTSGKKVKELLKQEKIDLTAVITDKQRQTTLKTRIGAGNQQIVRLDREERADIPPALEAEINASLDKVIPFVDAVIVEDYNKGLLTASLIKSVLAKAEKHCKPVTVDPKQKNFFAYLGVEVFKPNFSEMQKNLGLMLENEAELDKQAKLLRKKLKCKNLVITRGEKGLYIYSDSSKVHRIPTFAREVFDVSGAGDTVISTLTLALCEGCDIKSAAIIANHAAGIVCGKMGTATTTIDEIRQSYNEHSKNN